jgi:hypothetical protein
MTLYVKHEYLIGTWIITSGLNNGAAKLIGEGIDRLRALTDTQQPTVLLGISWWGNVTEKTRELVVGLQREVNNYTTIVSKKVICFL